MTPLLHLADRLAPLTARAVTVSEADAPPSSAATPSPAGIPSLPAGPGRPLLSDFAWVCVGLVGVLLANACMVAWVVA